MSGAPIRRVAQALPWLLAAFLAALMLSGAAARNLAIIMAVAGLVMQMLPGRPFDRRDLSFALAAAVLPAAYLLNMAVCGWNLKLLDRPAHLLWAIPVYLLVRRCGASPRNLLVGLGLAGLLAGVVALLAERSLLGSGELARLDQGRPMGPYSSPGAFGNYSAVIAVACLAGWLAWAQDRTNAWLRPLVLLGMGAVASVLGILGDLFASSVKRQVGIKDYGTIFPGHGGILDRFDSVMFIAPFVTMVITAVFYA